MKINVTLKKKNPYKAQTISIFLRGKKKIYIYIYIFVCKSKLYATGPQPQGLQQVLQIENFPQSKIGKAEKKKERKIWNV